MILPPNWKRWQSAADPAENDPSTDNDDDAHLDEDQQKAFESIMAQIEGGGADEGESASEAPQDQQAEPGPRMILPPNWKRWPAPQTRRKTIPQPMMTTMRI
jgi:hypothetical protein